ncbi:NPCBM/NEW2 domain-containing protein [Deinococcus aerius]|uniref:NPCBM/NEW2 domain-containing protein n=1 Tax=Deinococcus aerius TaxID=200253 RepID=UPI001F30E9EA|nr:NPCBM/NEW2 domain-containing protein [Deinococcus aerius]
MTACSQSSPPAASDPYANGASYSWAYTAPAGRLSALSLTPGENNLYFEPILAARNGWGPIEIDRSNGEQAPGDGRPLTLNGKTYARGFGTHAGSELRYSLRGTGAVCTRFTADIGVDDEVGNRGSVVFQVYLDGVKAYDSGTITGASATRQVNLDIRNRQELRLVVTDAGNGKSSDHADWAVPKVFCERPASGRLDTTFGSSGRADVGGSDAVLEPGGAVLISDTAGGDFVLKRLAADGTVRQVTTDFGGPDAAYAIARQPDGKVVVVGQSGNNFAAARYNPDLTLDTGFGTGGKVITDLGSLGLEAAYAVAVQGDGRIVAAGTTVQPVPEGTPSSNDLAVVRYNANGTLDSTFGTGGVVVQRFDPPSDYSVDEARAVAVQPDGRIVIAGKADASGGGRSRLLMRLNANGAPDTTFAGSGLIRGDIYSIFNDVALEPDGDIVVVGYEGRYFGNGVVQRYGPGGALQDETQLQFTADLFGNQNVLSDVLVQPDGKILVGGAAYTPPANGGTGLNEYAFARLNSSLSLDTSFGTGGKVLTGLGVALLPSGGEETPLGALLRQSDGKIVVVATQSARYWP